MPTFQLQMMNPRWASPEIEMRYQQLLADANYAAKMAAQPYLDEAAKLANMFMTFDPVILKVDDDDH